MFTNNFIYLSSPSDDNFYKDAQIKIKKLRCSGNNNFFYRLKHEFHAAIENFLSVVTFLSLISI